MEWHDDFVLYRHLMLFWKFLRFLNSAWVNFGFSLNFVGSLGTFSGYDFCLHSNHPRHLKFGVPPWSFKLHWRRVEWRG